MAAKPPTISALRSVFAKYKDDDSIEKVWQNEEDQKLLKQVSLLVRREESKGGQASLSPRVRALRAITSDGHIDPPSDDEMLSWSEDASSFWAIRLEFDGQREINVISEALSNRLRMITHLDALNRSLRIRKRFLCLFFYDFAKSVHPKAERLGAATIRSVVAQLHLCGMLEVDVDELKQFMAVGRRLDELAQLAGTGSIFCLPKQADEGTRLEQLGELISELAKWLDETSYDKWNDLHHADALGDQVRSLLIESASPSNKAGQRNGQCDPVSALDFMFVQ